MKEGEGLTVEFKEKYTPKIVQDIVGFANSKGGKIILGVADNGRIEGEELTGKLKAEIFSLGRNCDPKIEVSVKQVEDVVVVNVDEGSDKPYSCSSTYYKRFDAVTQKLNRNETKAIFDFNTSSYFDEKTNPKAKLEDISLKKVWAFYKAAGIKYKVSQETLPNVLKSLNLMDGNSITNAGVLFFAEKIDSFFLHSQVMLLAFKDYKGAVIFDRKEVRGDLLAQFNESEFFLKRHLSLQGIIEGMKRRNVYEVPQEAWREAIANAIIHRDYKFGGTSIQVRVFPDRIEVISPGRLPKGVTPKNIGELSSRRNEIIADMFARLDVIEKAGTGIIRIREAMEAEGLQPPAFEDMGEFFKIILYRPLGVKESAEANKKLPGKTTLKTAQKIINIIRDNPKISRKEIAQILENITEDAVKYQLNKLQEKGAIKHIGPAKGGHWEVIDESKK